MPGLALDTGFTLSSTDAEVNDKQIAVVSLPVR